MWRGVPGREEEEEAAGAVTGARAGEGPGAGPGEGTALGSTGSWLNILPVTTAGKTRSQPRPSTQLQDGNWPNFEEEKGCKNV